MRKTFIIAFASTLVACASPERAPATLEFPIDQPEPSRRPALDQLRNPLEPKHILHDSDTASFDPNDKGGRA